MNALQRDLKKLVPLVESLGAEKAAADPHRQRFHLQPPVGWLNDPNGLCVYGGQYHAFFQYGPFDVNGGVKHWGHAVSTDLLHWEQLPVMLYPDEPFDCHGAYSGSALVEDGTMYLYYTGNVKHPGNFDYIKEGRGHNVCLAVSCDGAEQAVDVCFDLTAAPAGDFSLAFDGGLTLAYADADRTCCLTFTDDAMSGGRTSRYVKPDAPYRRLHGAVRLCPSRIFLHGTCIFCQMSLFDEMIAKIL